MEAMSGEESFRGWIAQYAQHFLDATNWQEFHGIADAHSVRLQIRANGFVFVDKESGAAAKASDVHRRLAKPALEARLGKFVDAETVKARAAQRAYRKKPRVNTEELWREYTAERDARRALYETKHALIRAETGERIRAAKNDATTGAWPQGCSSKVSPARPTILRSMSLSNALFARSTVTRTSSTGT